MLLQNGLSIAGNKNTVNHSYELSETMLSDHHHIPILNLTSEMFDNMILLHSGKFHALEAFSSVW
jgi:hypothetical protein